MVLQLNQVVSALGPPYNLSSTSRSVLNTERWKLVSYIYILGCHKATEPTHKRSAKKRESSTHHTESFHSPFKKSSQTLICLDWVKQHKVLTPTQSCTCNCTFGIYFLALKMWVLNYQPRHKGFFSHFHACKASYFNIFDTKLNIFLQSA